MNPSMLMAASVTDKGQPDDVDVVLDLQRSSDERQRKGQELMTENQTRFLEKYRVHFWINFTGDSDFSAFFQYIGAKTARFKGLNPRHLKGILRIDK